MSTGGAWRELLCGVGPGDWTLYRKALDVFRQVPPVLVFSKLQALGDEVVAEVEGLERSPSAGTWHKVFSSSWRRPPDWLHIQLFVHIWATQHQQPVGELLEEWAAGYRRCGGDPGPRFMPSTPVPAAVRRRQLPRGPVLLGGVAVAAAVAASIVFWPEGKGSTEGPEKKKVHSSAPVSGGAPSGNPSTKTRGIENLGFTVASSDKSYRAILPLQNLQNEDRLLDEVELIVTFRGPACAEVPFILVYGIQAPITVDPSGKIKKGSVSADSGLAKGFTTPTSGELNWGCGMDQLQLRFRPSGAVLARKSTTSILIDIPRKLSVTKMINGVDGFETSKAELPSMSDPYADYIAFHAISTVDSGEKISSCFLLAASDYKPATGTQRCDTEIEKVPVFWRQKYGPNRSWLKYERVS